MKGEEVANFLGVEGWGLKKSQFNIASQRVTKISEVRDNLSSTQHGGTAARFSLGTFVQFPGRGGVRGEEGNKM